MGEFQAKRRVDGGRGVGSHYSREDRRPCTVRPNLDYSVKIWNSFYHEEKKIEKFQRRPTKMVKEFEDDSYEGRLHILNLMSTEIRRERRYQIMCYKILNKNNEVKVDEHLTIKDI